MLIKTKPKGKIFSLGGTIAAIMDEKVWELLLAGRRLCILEPDDVRWTLVLEGHPIDVIRAATKKDAAEAFVSRVPAFAAMCDVLIKGKEPAAHWHIISGFPNYLECSPEQRTVHEKAGRTDAKKIAAFYRKLVEKNAKIVLAEELSRHNTKFEGND